jgi:hypothetical protein
MRYPDAFGTTATLWLVGIASIVIAVLAYCVILGWTLYCTLSSLGR